MNALLSILCIVFGLVSSDGDVVELTEANFEHLTQLSTGATTGDWFIKFYAPWCGHCKRLAPTWEEVATELKGEVNVAKVDVTGNRALGKQFDVKGFPTLLLFRRGKMVKYSGARTKDAMVEWAKSAEGDAEVPGPVAMTEKVLGSLVQVLEDLVGVLNKFPIPSILLLVAGLLIGMMLGAVMCGGSVEYVERKVYVERSADAKANGPPPAAADPTTKKKN